MFWYFSVENPLQRCLQEHGLGGGLRRRRGAPDAAACGASFALGLGEALLVVFSKGKAERRAGQSRANQLFVEQVLLAPHEHEGSAVAIGR